MTQMQFDATGIDPTPRFDPIPAGEYLVAITDSKVRPTKDGANSFLELTLDVIEGEFQGRKLFDRLNLWNNNAKAVEIANRQLSQICHAVNVLQVQDSTQLHDKPLLAMVKLRPAAGEYDASNEVKGYKACAAAGAPTGTAAAPGAPAAAQQPARPTAPWAKRAA